VSPELRHFKRGGRDDSGGRSIVSNMLRVRHKAVVPLQLVGAGDDRRMKPERPFVSVIVPTFNRKDKLCRLLRSLMDSEQPEADIEIIVVDDGSSDGTEAVVRELFPEIVFVRTERPSFISHTRNVGIQNARGGLLFLIDDDNVVDKACLKTLVDSFRQCPEAGMIGPLMLYFEQTDLIWCAGVDRSMITSLTHFIGRGQIDKGQFSNLIPTKDLPNAFMLRREAIIKAGPFDEVLFPIHYEESDLGERFRRAGYHIYCQPAARDWHDIPVPSKKSDPLRRIHVHSPERAYYAGRNRVLFFRLYSSAQQYAIFALIFNWAIVAHYLSTILRGKTHTWEERKSIARSYLDGIFEGFRMPLDR